MNPIYKKILISLFSVILLFNLATSPLHTHAVVASKVASLTGKKIAKEVIQEAAINQAANMAVLEAIEISNKYQSKTGYKIVCLDGTKTCEKPMQIKTDLTEADKTNIKKQSELELDKLITPDGKGFSKWEKYMDWFLPIWAVSFATAALTYTFDEGVRSLFNEAAYNTLVSLGIMEEVVTTELIPPTEIPIPNSSTVPVDSPGEKTNITDKAYSRTLDFDNLNIPASGTLFQWEVMTSESPITSGDKSSSAGVTISFESPQYQTTSAVSMLQMYSSSNSSYMQLDTRTLGTIEAVTIDYNLGQITETFYTNTETGSYALRPDKTLEAYKASYGKIDTMHVRWAVQIDGKYYTDFVYLTTDKNLFHIQVQSTDFVPTTLTDVKLYNNYNTNAKREIRGSLFLNQNPYKTVIIPPFEEVSPDFDAVEQSSFSNGNNVALIPPEVITYKDETTGERVYRKANETGDGIDFTKEDGTIVPEENITVGDPVVTKTPQGQPQVTPEPTPSNPNPEPIPLTPEAPTQTQPPTTPPPDIDTTEPYFPEGENCSEGLKIPKFVPLLTSISETFPFSIPFDLYGGFEAIFAEMGTEKPEFDFEFTALGEKHVWVITIPDFIDDWKPFMDSILIFVFDVGLIYAIFRFTGGGK